MKLPKQVDIQYSNRLFSNKFKYKVVLRLSNSGKLRGLNVDNIFDRVFSKFDKNEEKFCRQLIGILQKNADFQIRIETPYASIYTNSENTVEKLTSIDSSKVKYVSIPSPDAKELIVDNTVALKTLDFNFRVNLGQTRQNYSNFVEWAESNPKLKLPKRCKRDLSKNYSNGGSYFYVKDEKVLTMVKMFLGSTITRVENVVRA